MAPNSSKSDSGNDSAANIRMEPTRLLGRAIMPVKRAAHSARWAGKASEEDSIKEMKGFSGPVVQHCLR